MPVLGQKERCLCSCRARRAPPPWSEGFSPSQRTLLLGACPPDSELSPLLPSSPPSILPRMLQIPLQGSEL